MEEKEEEEKCVCNNAICKVHAEQNALTTCTFTMHSIDLLCASHYLAFLFKLSCFFLFIYFLRFMDM